MGVVGRFGAYGLTPGNVLLTDDHGGGDLGLYVNQSTTPTISATGLRSPRLKFDQVASTTAYVAWGPTRLDNRTFTDCAVRLYLELSAYASASFSIINTATGATSNWKIDIAGTSGVAGELRIRDGSNVQYASTGGDGNVIPLNTIVRLEFTVTAAGAFAVYVYNGDSTTPLFTKSGTGLPTPSFQSIRFGNVSTSPTVPTHYMDDFAISNTATLIGPRPAITAGVWNGTKEVPADLKVWNGTSEVAASLSSIV